MNQKTISAFLSSARLETLLFSLLLILLPTQLGKHFWPFFSYIYSLKIDYLAVTVYFWDFLVYLLWIVSLGRKQRVNLGSLGVLGIFGLLEGISLVFSGTWGVGFA